MKSCPVCHRNFDDVTLSFCTEDGTPLIVSNRSTDPTLHIPGRRDTDAPATEVLPHGYQPPAAPNSGTWPNQPGVAGADPAQVAPTQYAGHVPPPRANFQPVNPSYQPSMASAPPAPNRTPWLIASAILAFVAVGGIIGVAYLLLRTDEPSNKNTPAAVTPTPTPSANTNRPAANSNTAESSNTNTGGETSSDWLEGEWEGTGDNPDGSTWSVVLIRDVDGTAISYPKLKCTGVWEENSLGAETATFTERIRSGTCDDGTSIKVTRLTENQISVSWIVENSDIPVTSATLNRTSSAQAD